MGSVAEARLRVALRGLEAGDLKLVKKQLDFALKEELKRQERERA